MPKRILILGGTGLARQAAAVLVEQGLDVIYSLAGVTHSPSLPKGNVRVGGFGGVEGLRAYVLAEKIEQVVDATHAFAKQMSGNAVAACAQENIPFVRLESPPWQFQAGDQWIEVAIVAEAVHALPQGSKAVVTVGRKEAASFFARADLSGAIRMIEPPLVPAPQGWKLLLERPPFTKAAEIDLLRTTGADYLVSKNAGGPRPAKLDAAAALGLPVIMWQRPVKAAARTVYTVEQLFSQLA